MGLTFHKVYDFPVVFTGAADVFGPVSALFRIMRSIFYYLEKTSFEVGVRHALHHVM